MLSCLLLLLDPPLLLLLLLTVVGLFARLNGAVSGVRGRLATRPAVGRVEVVELWPNGEKKKTLALDCFGEASLVPGCGPA